MSELQLLIVEDSAMVQEFYRDLLEDPRLREEFHGVQVNNAKAAIQALHRKPPDIVILDLVLPDKDGLSILDVIRSDPKTRSAMVFVVTGDSSAEKEVEALQFGADDYLKKPFNREVLVTRLLNLAKRIGLPPEPHETVALKDFQLEMPLGRLKIHGKQIILHRKEAELFRIFLKRPNMIHSADYLWSTVWGYESGDFQNTLHVTLSSLRKKLGAHWGHCLENVRDRGYILTLP